MDWWAWPLCSTAQTPWPIRLNLLFDLSVGNWTRQPCFREPDCCCDSRMASYLSYEYSNRFMSFLLSWRFGSYFCYQAILRQIETDFVCDAYESSGRVFESVKPCFNSCFRSSFCKGASHCDYSDSSCYFGDIHLWLSLANESQHLSMVNLMKFLEWEPYCFHL